MLGPQNGFYFALVVILLAGGVIWKLRGLFHALGIVVALSFAFPVWLVIPVAGVPIRIQTAAAIVGLLALTLTSPRKILSPLVWLDAVVAGLVVLQFLSDTHHGVPAVPCGFLAYGEWALPYVAGRYAMRNTNAVEDLGICLSGVLVVLSVGGLVEMLTSVNPWEVVFGIRPLEGFSRKASRFGYHRAYGTTLHPIFFGLLILTLSPWPVAVWKWFPRGPFHNLAIGGMIASMAGVVASLSRGPLLGLVAFGGALAAVWNRWCRWSFAVVVVALVGWLVVDFNGVLKVLEDLGGEERRATKLTLDGESVDLSSTKHRVWQLKVYWPALYESGLLGYGTEAVKTLPPQVPHLPADEKTRKTLKFVDNAYMMLGLRFGWSGVLLFTLLLASAVWTGLRLAGDRSIGQITGALAAMLVAMAVSVLTVWFSYDMGFEVLWSIGVLGGLQASLKEGR